MLISCSSNTGLKVNLNCKPSISSKAKKKCFLKWALELILMHLLLEMNSWHFKNNLCLQFTVKIKPHHHFQHWQWDSSARVFSGWQTPALIHAWMMSSIHYTMIKSLPPTTTPAPQPHHYYESDIHQGPISAFLERWWALGDRGQGGTSLPWSQAAPENGAWWVKTQWPVRPPVTYARPYAAMATEKRNQISEMILKKGISHYKVIAGSKSNHFHQSRGEGKSFLVTEKSQYPYHFTEDTHPFLCALVV